MLKFYGFVYTSGINSCYSAYLPCFLLFIENVKAVLLVDEQKWLL